MKRRVWLPGLVIGVCLFFSNAIGYAASATQAYDAEKERAFFRGKVVNILVPSKAGGWFDAWARLIQPALLARLPGATVVVENIPGAGGVMAANRLFSATPDGTTIAVVNRTNPLLEALGQKGIRFKSAEFTWLGNTSNQGRFLFVSTKSPYKTIKDFVESKKPVKLGASGVGTVAWSDAFIIKKSFKMENLTIVPGYEGNQDVYRAVVQGEVDGLSALENDAVNRPKEEVRIILQMGGPKGYYPGVNVPTFAEVAPPSGKPYIGILDQQFYLARFWAAPPKVDPNRTKFLRDTFEAVCKDPKFIASVEKAGARVDFTRGERIQELIKEYLV